jgi:hypothetical protein
MKKLSKAAVALAIVAGTAATAPAADGVGGRVVRISPEKEGTFGLTYLNEGRNTVRVSILDDNGKPVFRETIHSGKSFYKPYNLQKLGDGAFQFKVEDKAGVVKERVLLGSAGHPAVASVTRLEGDRYLLKLKGTGTEPVYLAIFDRFNRMLFGERVDWADGDARLYNLSALAGESLVFEVSAGGKIIGKVKF